MPTPPADNTERRELHTLGLTSYQDLQTAALLFQGDLSLSYGVILQDGAEGTGATAGGPRAWVSCPITVCRSHLLEAHSCDWHVMCGSRCYFELKNSNI